MAYLDDIAIRYQVYLEGLKTGDYREFNLAIAAIEVEIRRELAVGEITELTEKNFAELLRRVSAATAGPLQESVDGLIPKLRALTLYAYQFEASALIAAAPALKNELTRAQKTKELYDLAKAQPMSATGDLLEPWISRMTSNEVYAVENLLRKGRAEGWTNSQFMQVLKGKRVNGFKDGLLARMGKSNETIVRTALQHTSEMGRQALWEENSDIVISYRWLATLDSKTSDKCRGLDGKVFKLGKGPVPPAHLNCRSTTVAVLDKKWDMFDKGATRSSEFGSVPQSMTYYQWLKDQPADYQDSVIGPERGALLRDGGLTVEEFTRLTLDSTFNPLTLDEMRRLKPLAFLKAGI